MPIPLNPTVKITFNGSMVFAFDYEKNPFDQAKCCHIGVLEVAKPKHVFRINRKTKVADVVEDYPEITPPIQSFREITIKIYEPQGKGWKEKYEGVHRFHSMKYNDPEDLRWIVDFEELHDRELKLRKGFPKHRIAIYGGLFYAAKQIPVSLVLPNGNTHDSISISSPVGCNFYLKDGERFEVCFDGKPRFEKLVIIAKADQIDEISILNTPLPKGHPRDLPSHDLPHYYEQAVDVPPGHYNIKRSTRLPGTGPKSASRSLLSGNLDPFEQRFGDPDNPCPTILLGRRKTGLPAPSAPQRKK